jgi:hypothetical protein
VGSSGTPYSSLSGAEDFTTFGASSIDPGILGDPRAILYCRAFAVNACGVSSAD